MSKGSKMGVAVALDGGWNREDVGTGAGAGAGAGTGALGLLARAGEKRSWNWRR